jgi:uncharacterized damage-inducible protein DinB
MPPVIARPEPTEHAPYAILYVEAAERALVETGNDDIITLLHDQPDQLRELLTSAFADDATARQRYAPDKWTLGESLVHMADTERVFAYRALRIARGDQTPLASFDQDAWVPHSRADRRSLADILDEIDAVREATLALALSLDRDAVTATGTAGTVTVSVRALLWIIAGHFAHHIGITRDRYL